MRSPQGYTPTQSVEWHPVTISTSDEARTHVDFRVVLTSHSVPAAAVCSGAKGPHLVAAHV